MSVRFAAANPLNTLHSPNALWRPSQDKECSRRSFSKMCPQRNWSCDEQDPPEQRFRLSVNMRDISGLTPACHTPMLKWLTEYGKHFLFGFGKLSSPLGMHCTFQSKVKTEKPEKRKLQKLAEEHRRILDKILVTYGHLEPNITHEKNHDSAVASFTSTQFHISNYEYYLARYHDTAPICEPNITSAGTILANAPVRSSVRVVNTFELKLSTPANVLRRGAFWRRSASSSRVREGRPSALSTPSNVTATLSFVETVVQLKHPVRGSAKVARGSAKVHENVHPFLTSSKKRSSARWEWANVASLALLIVTFALKMRPAMNSDGKGTEHVEDGFAVSSTECGPQQQETEESVPQREALGDLPSDNPKEDIRDEAIDDAGIEHSAAVTGTGTTVDEVSEARRHSEEVSDARRSSEEKAAEAIEDVCEEEDLHDDWLVVEHPEVDFLPDLDEQMDLDEELEKCEEATC